MVLDSISLVREGYARYAKNDFAGVFELLSTEVEIVQTNALPWGGRYVGHSGARQFFGELAKYTDARPKPESYFSAGDDVVVNGRLLGKTKTGVIVALAIVHLWTVHENRIIRFAAYIDTPAMLSLLSL